LTTLEKSAFMPNRFHKASVIEDVFAITGRGCIVAGEFALGLEVRRGVTLELRRAGVVVFSSVVSGVDIAPRPTRALSLLVRGLDKATVQIGDEIWLEVNAQP
jgi:translation elongation factor EF-Tu-like GTPase